MKGLILKDLYSVRFSLICSALLMLIPGGFMMLLGGGFFTGGESALIRDSAAIAFGMGNFSMICMLSPLALSTLTSDKTSRWSLIQRAMPVNGKQIALSKLILCYIVIGILTVFALLVNCFALIYGYSAEVLVMMPICIALIEVMIISPVIPLSFKLGIKIANYIHLAMIFLVLGVLSLVFLASMLLPNAAVFIRIFAYGILPVAAAAVAYASYKSAGRYYSADIT